MTDQGRRQTPDEPTEADVVSRVLDWQKRGLLPDVPSSRGRSRIPKEDADMSVLGQDDLLDQVYEVFRDEQRQGADDRDALAAAIQRFRELTGHDQ